MQNLSTWITRVSRYCADPNNSRFSTTDITDALIVACNDVWNYIVTLHPEHYQTEYDLSTVADQAGYDLPPDFERPLALEDREDVSSTDHGIDWESAAFRSRIVSYGWDIRGSKLHFHDTPGSAVTDKWRLHYVRRIAEPSYGTAAAGSTTSLTLAASPTYGDSVNQDDYYNNSRILIVSGGGAGEIRTVSDYVGSTRAATIDTGTAITTASVYSILPDIPDHAAALVCFMATVDALSAQEAPNLLIWVRRAKEARRELARRMLMRDSTEQPSMRIE
jgi:hypothetical protein